MRLVFAAALAATVALSASARAQPGPDPQSQPQPPPPPGEPPPPPPPAQPGPYAPGPPGPYAPGPYAPGPYAPGPPGPYAPGPPGGYLPPPSAYQPTPEEQELLNDGFIRPERAAIGGVVAFFIGFGIDPYGQNIPPLCDGGGAIALAVCDATDNSAWPDRLTPSTAQDRGRLQAQLGDR